MQTLQKMNLQFLQQLFFLVFFRAFGSEEYEESGIPVVPPLCS
ncbi:hypothetical protein SAMN05444266_10672 [Chitinophaga jiangningensis]|uniref:Uncharacterized protein n=1 Tax=Chitinophaga jiangningensis TaxID=1419482 RepID=A0A1M7FBJ5_9BACT|nr:hypothetical protein SAMN05444266_10672 [Chitinophaga jiangningensis]